MRINSIRIKIVSLIFFALLIIVGIALYISIYLQKSNLITATKRTLATNTEILNRVIRNIMLNGEAPIAVNTMASLSEIQEFNEVIIYRIDGSNAFNDYKTVNFVNNYQKDILFPKTPRIEKNIFYDNNFRKVLETHSPIEFLDLEKEKNIEYFFPILNMPECRKCHGETPFIRGIAHFTISVQDTYRQINNAAFLLTLFFIFIGIIFAVILIFFMRNLIIFPLIKIGNAVKNIGQGDLDTVVDIKNKDELGDLALKINEMIKGLNERFHLSKYVSKSTEDLIKRGGHLNKAGEKKSITVLFSDVRGFTSYSESNDPEVVIENLNRILEAQAETVEKFGGDIDKFVGDELMAIFNDEYTAVSCAYEMIRIVYGINKKYNTELYIGIGINSGNVIAGNIGSKTRHEYAVIGDTVNLASRLCGMARKNMILISESVNEKISDKIKSQLIPDQKIKGKIGTINFYAVEKIE